MTAKQSRDKRGRFSSTALTKTRDAAIKKAGGVDALYEMIESGIGYREIARVLGLDEANYATRSAVRQILRCDPDRYEEAKRESAEALAERAGECYGDEAPTASADAKWRNDKSGWFRWMAETRDPSIRQAGVSVNVDIGSLHLDALRASGRMTLNPDRVREAVEAEYKVEDE